MGVVGAGSCSGMALDRACSTTGAIMRVTLKSEIGKGLMGEEWRGWIQYGRCMDKQGRI